jgi:hypothetical protein
LIAVSSRPSNIWSDRGGTSALRPPGHRQQRHQRAGPLIEQRHAARIGAQQFLHERAATVQRILYIVAHQHFAGQIAQRTVGVDAAPIDRRRAGIVALLHHSPNMGQGQRASRILYLPVWPISPNDTIANRY